MNLLSIGAAFGVVQAIFERGWLHNLVGAQRSPIEAFIPVIVFAIVFGLSMDYEVFLVSRIREEWQHRGDPSAAIRAGVVHTGRVITAAAAVMVVVFSSFAASDNHILKLFGLWLAVAVFLDAVVIRSLLLPAVLELSGRVAWKFPTSLDRRLPRLAIEPPTRELKPTQSPKRTNRLSRAEAERGVPGSSRAGPRGTPTPPQADERARRRRLVQALPTARAAPTPCWSRRCVRAGH
jgi:RND superfamily putative drug exporter